MAHVRELLKKQSYKVAETAEIEVAHFFDINFFLKIKSCIYPLI